MEQLGVLLLGFAVGAPAVLLIRGIITARSELCRPLTGTWPPDRWRTAPLPRCDPQAVAAYFGEPKTDAGQPLSIAELASLLGGAARYGLPAMIRFDGEGGYRLRL